jgi:hypothetical protein
MGKLYGEFEYELKLEVVVFLRGCSMKWKLLFQSARVINKLTNEH